MKRPYDRPKYKDVINNLKKLSRDVVIGTDVIVGFPGESEKDFKCTLNLLKELDIFYLHILPWTARSQ